MKKLFLMTIIVLSFVSCSKTEADFDANFDYDTELLFGTWQVTKMAGEAWTLETTILSFTSDGKYHSIGYFGNKSGRYELSDKTINVYVGDKKYMWYDVTSLKTDNYYGITTCALLANDNLGRAQITCQKI